MAAYDIGLTTVSKLQNVSTALDTDLLLLTRLNTSSSNSSKSISMEDLFKSYLKPLVNAMIYETLSGLDLSKIGSGSGNCIFSGSVVSDSDTPYYNDKILDSSGRTLHVGDLYLNVDN